MDRSTYAPPPHKFEAGTPPIARRSASARRWTTCPRSGMDAIAAHEQELTGVRAGRAARHPRRDGSSARRRRRPRGGDGVIRCSTAIHPHDVGQMLDDARRRGAGGAPLRPAAAPAVRDAGDHPGVVLPVQDARPRSTPWSAASHHVREGVRRGRDAARVDVPGDHPGPLQAPARPGAAGAVRRRGPPREPDLRRRGHAAGAGWPTAARSATSPTTARAARSARPPPRCCTIWSRARPSRRRSPSVDEFLG